MFKKILQLKLKYAAVLILKKYKPDIIGITGSVGKTSAKEAVYTVLSKKYRVRRSIKNYNNEIGVPLAIIGLDSPGRSLAGWLFLFLKVVKMLLVKDPEYPQVLILEMGIDRPGDMEYLLGIVRPRIGVITMVGPVHLEFFGSIDKIQSEKGALVRSLPNDGYAILNYDDEHTRQISDCSKAKVITYGFSDRAKLRATELIFSFKEQDDPASLRGINFKMGYAGSFVPILLPKVVGYNAIYASLAGAAVGLAYGMNLVEISQALLDLDSPKGRMNILPGIKHTIIIDDTYNASPPSMIAALETLAMMPVGRENKKFAILGDMFELGGYSIEGHELVGRKIVELKIDHLIVVGERSRGIAHSAAKAGMDEDAIYHFDDIVSAGRFAQERIKTGDVILVKGSQGMRMEKIVKEIMADPLRAKELLVRQDEGWTGK